MAGAPGGPTFAPTAAFPTSAASAGSSSAASSAAAASSSSAASGSSNSKEWRMLQSPHQHLFHEAWDNLTLSASYPHSQRQVNEIERQGNIDYPKLFDRKKSPLTRMGAPLTTRGARFALAQTAFFRSAFSARTPEIQGVGKNAVAVRNADGTYADRWEHVSKDVIILILSNLPLDSQHLETYHWLKRVHPLLEMLFQEAVILRTREIKAMEHLQIVRIQRMPAFSPESTKAKEEFRAQQRLTWTDHRGSCGVNVNEPIPPSHVFRFWKVETSKELDAEEALLNEAATNPEAFAKAIPERTKQLEVNKRLLTKLRVENEKRRKVRHSLIERNRQVLIDFDRESMELDKAKAQLSSLKGTSARSQQEDSVKAEKEYKIDQQALLRRQQLIRLDMEIEFQVIRNEVEMESQAAVDPHVELAFLLADYRRDPHAFVRKARKLITDLQLSESHKVSAEKDRLEEEGQILKIQEEIAYAELFLPKIREEYKKVKEELDRLKASGAKPKPYEAQPAPRAHNSFSEHETPGRDEQKKDRPGPKATSSSSRPSASAAASARAHVSEDSDDGRRPTSRVRSAARRRHDSSSDSEGATPGRDERKDDRPRAAAAPSSSRPSASYRPSAAAGTRASGSAAAPARASASRAPSSRASGPAAASASRAPSSRASGSARKPTAAEQFQALKKERDELMKKKETRRKDNSDSE